jgi:hypothetical protein
MYLMDKLPPYENNYENDHKYKDVKQNKSDTLQLLYALTFFFVVCFTIYNNISFLNVQIEYNKMLIYNSNTEYKKTSYNTLTFLLLTNMILNMMYYLFTNILINKNVTGSRYYTFSCIICVTIIISMLIFIHNNILYKINELMNSIVLIDSANYYHLVKHINVSNILYFVSYLINIIIVFFLM